MTVKRKSTNTQQRALQNRFVELNGYWSSGWEAVLRGDKDFFEACLELMGAPAKLEKLQPSMRELIHIAINVACTHFNAAGTRRHVRRALDKGATSNEIAETVQLAAVLGIHSCSIGVPLLLTLNGTSDGTDGSETAQLDASRQQLKDNFIAKRGYWTPIWDGLLQRSPDFFAAYTRFSSTPWEKGVLSPKNKELIYIAIDIVTNHLFVPGTEIHMKNALGYGASIDEILEVIETVSLIGLDSAALGFEILEEEMGRQLGRSAGKGRTPVRRVLRRSSSRKRKDN